MASTGTIARRTSLNKDARIAELEARVVALEAALDLAQIDPQFAVLTRSGIDQRWHKRPAQVDMVIFFDIDRVHDHNEQWGYAETDKRIEEVMAQVGNSWVFRWFSGDEFGLVCTAADASGFAKRVQGLLQERGMSATFGIAPIIADNLKASMAVAAALVQTAKAGDLRATINRAP